MKLPRKSEIALAIFGAVVVAAAFAVAGLLWIRSAPVPENAPRAPEADSTLPPREDAPVAPEKGLWDETGRRWRLHVKRWWHGPGHVSLVPVKPHVQFEYGMTVEEAPMRHRGDQKIARFLFTSEADASDFLGKQQYVLEIDEGTGVAEGVKTVGVSQYELNGLTSMIEVFGTEKYLRTQLDGFPADWIVRLSDLTRIPKEREERTEVTTNKQVRFVRTLEQTTVPGNFTDDDTKQRGAVRLTFSMETGEGSVMYRLSQVWVPGEPWWRSFQRWRQDNLDLEAVRLEDK